MLSEREVSAAVGSTAYGADGDKLGTVEHFFVDDRTGAPTWVSVTTGLFGTRRSVVPAVDATFADGSLRLPVTAEAVKSAPNFDSEHLDPAAEAELRRHYGIGDPGTGDPGMRDPGMRDTVDTRDDRGLDEAAMAAPTQEMSVVPPPPADGDAGRSGTDGGMVRSEERLVVGTERVATTRARLVKYVVTEEVQITVPIRREEIRVEEVPLDAPDPGPGESLLDDRDGAGSRVPASGHDTGASGYETGASGYETGASGYDTGAYRDPGGLPDEIILHTERPVVTVEVVPVERVRLRTETVTGQEQDSGQVQREQIVVDESPPRGSLRSSDAPSPSSNA